jgi:2-oxoglutarate ferredoxin oxidoreductase subunit beta
MGDGDATAIGGNHFIHAARRNLNMTAIIINNQTYGMTGGQHSPTTPYGCYATTSFYGNIEHAFSIAELAVTAGAPFVARGTVYHAQLLEGLIEKGIRKRGFSVVEVVSTCPVHFGRQNEMGDPVEMMKWLKDHAVTTEKADKMPPEALEDKFTIGVLADVEKPIYTKEYQRIRKRAKALLKESKE